jgi:glucosamine-6-phosphate deaminase
MINPVNEKLQVNVYARSRDASVFVARKIADLIRSTKGRACVLGLATGSTPTGVYSELVRMHREEGLSFKNVITFNLDEYFPMEPDSLQSYVRFMQEHLFNHIDIPAKNVNIPDGTVPVEQAAAFCASYEKKIKDCGGLDLQLLGIGRTGHVGFNEPGSPTDSRTRLITLDKLTRMDAASDFYGENFVPRRAITMGVGSILDARQIILMAFGEGKAKVVRQAVEGPITAAIPATFLQRHADCLFVVDEAAAADLTRVRCPWLSGAVEWDEKRIKQAVIWLASNLKKPILNLTDEDYNEAGLQDLLALHGPAYSINLDAFRSLQQTITGWPGGKPDHLKRKGDISRPTDRIFPKRVIVFSPHPDDDVISMGGTLIRLADQSHDLHIAYQTSGNIAVFDHDAMRFADFAADFNRLFGIDAEITKKIEARIGEVVKHKEPGKPDHPDVQRIKTLIRRGEAKAGASVAGVADHHCHFLDMPFYETGVVKKKPIGEADIQLVVDLLRKIQPQQIYAAGDLSDPHGTHRVCLEAIFRAVAVVQKEEWFADTEIWLYRGAWQEWEPQQIDMAVPISPPELERKRQAIFKHQSQKDRAMFPGADVREFWQRAEDRNRDTARWYDQLGMAQYAAIEGFVRWYPPGSAPAEGSGL